MMRRHVTEAILHPLFMREVPSAPDITLARKAVSDWLHLRLFGPGTSLLSAGMPDREVIISPAPNPEDLRKAMDALCIEVGEEPPSTSYCFDGDKHPALLLHWCVQAYLVSHLGLDSRLEYRGFLPGHRVNGRHIRTFTMNRGPPRQFCRLVVGGWTHEVPPDSPPRKAHQMLQKRRRSIRRGHRPHRLRLGGCPGGLPTNGYLLRRLGPAECTC